MGAILKKKATAEPKPARSPSRNNYAVINTVDTIIGFPKRGVYVFGSRRHAVMWAAHIIREHVHDGQVEALSADDVLDQFQSTLDSVEYFHVERVRKP